MFSSNLICTDLLSVLRESTSTHTPYSSQNSHFVWLEGALGVSNSSTYIMIHAKSLHRVNAYNPLIELLRPHIVTKMHTQSS